MSNTRARQSSHPDIDLFVVYRRTRSWAVRNQLVERYDGVAQRCALRFAGRGEATDDLRQGRVDRACTQSEIGARLGVGEVQVSRLLKAALARLREHCDVDDLVGAATCSLPEPGTPSVMPPQWAGTAST